MAKHLVIGLGGTGGSVLRSLRKRIYQECRTKESVGNVHIEYLYVDSDLADLNNETDWQIQGESVQLPMAQRLHIPDLDSRVLSNLDQYPGIRSFIDKTDEQLLHEGFSESLDGGSGSQCRRVSRMMLAQNMCRLPQDTFIGYVHARVRALNERDDSDNVTFHICAGLGGGIGSGTIIDAVAQIRNEFRKTGGHLGKFKILLYLYVPEEVIRVPGGEELNPCYQSNGYAALLELNALSVGRYYPTDVTGKTDEHGQVNRLLQEQSAFDLAYLYSNVNENGEEVNLYNELPGIVGDFLFHKLVVASIDNHRFNIEYMVFEPLSCFPESDEHQGFVHACRFMTFGLNRIEYPEEEVVEYGAYHMAAHAVCQMLYGNVDEKPGFLPCPKHQDNYDYQGEISEKNEIDLLETAYLTLEKPLPSIEKYNTKWKYIVNEWGAVTESLKDSVMIDCPNKEWLDEFNNECQLIFDKRYRRSGVNQFYLDSEMYLYDYAEEICQRIDHNQLKEWQSGRKSILQVYKYIDTLIDLNERRIEHFKETITKTNDYIYGRLSQELEDIRREWNQIIWPLDCLTHSSTKIFGRFVEARREHLTKLTLVSGYSYAVKLLTEVNNRLRQLNGKSIVPFKTILTRFAERMYTLAEERCKLSDGYSTGSKSHVIKIYNPKQVRETVLTILQEREHNHFADLRDVTIYAAGDPCNSFYDLARKTISPSVLENPCLKVCMERTRMELADYSTEHPDQRLVNVNILDLLRHTVCSTDDKRKKFVRDIYGAAQSFLTFNGSEALKGCPETAAQHCKKIQICLPMSMENPAFRDEFIKDFRESGMIVFREDDDVSVNFKTNQIVVYTVHFGFPLRYVDNVRVLKKKYDRLVRNEAKRMAVHTESFDGDLPSLFYHSSDEK